MRGDSVDKAGIWRLRDAADDCVTMYNHGIPTSLGDKSMIYLESLASLPFDHCNRSKLPTIPDIGIPFLHTRKFRHGTGYTDRGADCAPKSS